MANQTLRDAEGCSVKMNKMKRYIITIFALAVVLPVVLYLVSPIWNVQELQEASPLQQESTREDVIPELENTIGAMTSETKKQFDEAIVLASGSFVAGVHEVAGTAKLIAQGTKHTLRFENFETINGPDLHIYLATDRTAEDFIDLGAIRATKGSVNYAVPVDVDLQKYKMVLVWCVPFRVLFSSAELH